MLIKVKKEVEETIEIKTPCWLANKFGFYAHVTEGGDLIEVFGGTIVLKDASDATNISIAKLLEDYHSCTEEAFKEALDKRLFNIEEKYTGATA